MGLAHPEGKALVERIAEHEPVNEARVLIFRDTHDAAATHGSNALT